MQKKVTGLTTFYLPPKDPRPADPEMAARLGLRIIPGAKGITGPYPIDKPYSEADKAAVAALDTHVLPKNYRRLRATPALRSAMQKLALEPASQRLYLKSPAAFASTITGLRSNERRALETGRPYPIVSAMKASSTDEANQFVQDVLRSPTLAQQWSDEVVKYSQTEDGADQITAWLVSKGYDTTFEEVLTAFNTAANQSLDFYDSSYNTQLDNTTAGPSVVIQKGQVHVDGKNIVMFNYENSKLTWSASDGNDSTASLTMEMLTTNPDGTPLPDNSYVGPEFYGTYQTKGATSASQIIGRVGTIPDGSGGDHLKDGVELSTFNDTYQTYVKDASGTYQRDASTLIVDAPNVTYGDQPLKNFTWANGTLTASTEDGNAWNLSLLFYVNTTPSDSNPTAGNQFSGKRWAAGATAPTAANMFGQIGSASNPAATGSALDNSSMWTTLAINVAVGYAGMKLAEYVWTCIKRFVAWAKSGSQADKDALDEAQKDVDKASDSEEMVEEKGVDINPDGEVVDPASLPEPVST